jgi:hypothetical protein
LPPLFLVAALGMLIDLKLWQSALSQSLKCMNGTSMGRRVMAEREWCSDERCSARRSWRPG